MNILVHTHTHTHIRSSVFPFKWFMFRRWQRAPFAHYHFPTVHGLHQPSIIHPLLHIRGVMDFLKPTTTPTTRSQVRFDVGSAGSRCVAFFHWIDKNLINIGCDYACGGPAPAFSLRLRIVTTPPRCEGNRFARATIPRRPSPDAELEMFRSWEIFCFKGEPNE